MRGFTRFLIVAVALLAMAIAVAPASAGVFRQRTVIRQGGFFPNRVVVNRVNFVNPAPVVVNGFGVHGFGVRGFFGPQTVVVPHGGCFAPSGGFSVSGGCF